MIPSNVHIYTPTTIDTNIFSNTLWTVNILLLAIPISWAYIRPVHLSLNRNQKALTSFQLNINVQFLLTSSTSTSKNENDHVYCTHTLGLIIGKNESSFVQVLVLNSIVPVGSTGRHLSKKLHCWLPVLEYRYYRYSL
jgi:hypothetical protein